MNTGHRQTEIRELGNLTLWLEFSKDHKSFRGESRFLVFLSALSISIDICVAYPHFKNSWYPVAINLIPHSRPMTWMSQLVAGVPISDSFVDHSTLYEYFTIRVGAFLGGGQNFERRNIVRLKFRNFKVTNIKITKDEFFDTLLSYFFIF